jgi:hypothetical protein
MNEDDLPDGVTFEDLPDEIRSDQVHECPVCDFVSANITQHIAHKHPTVRDAYRSERKRVYIYTGDD